MPASIGVLIRARQSAISALGVQGFHQVPRVPVGQGRGYYRQSFRTMAEKILAASDKALRAQGVW